MLDQNINNNNNKQIKKVNKRNSLLELQSKLIRIIGNMSQGIYFQGF